MKISSINSYNNNYYKSTQTRPINYQNSPSMCGVGSLLKSQKTQVVKNNFIKNIKDYFLGYPKRINYTWQHKKAFLMVERNLCGKNSLQGYLHDADKLFMYIIGVPKKVAHNIHVATSPHHIRNGKVKSPMMAVIDWESAKYTKPDKPLTAREYYEQKCPKIPEIEVLLDKFGL